jgi:hypothetical protein
MKKNRNKKTTYVIVEGLAYLQTSLSPEELKMIIGAEKLRKIDDFE